MWLHTISTLLIAEAHQSAALDHSLLLQLHCAILTLSLAALNYTHQWAGDSWVWQHCNFASALSIPSEYCTVPGCAWNRWRLSPVCRQMYKEAPSAACVMATTVPLEFCVFNCIRCAVSAADPAVQRVVQSALRMRKVRPLSASHDCIEIQNLSYGGRDGKERWETAKSVNPARVSLRGASSGLREYAWTLINDPPPPARPLVCMFTRFRQEAATALLWASRPPTVLQHGLLSDNEMGKY